MVLGPQEGYARLVATSAPQRPPLAAPADDPRTVRAWHLYLDSLNGLEGEEYVTAEQRAWERLERMLGEIARNPARAR
jgi:hypothetical protein